MKRKTQPNRTSAGKRGASSKPPQKAGRTPAVRATAKRKAVKQPRTRSAARKTARSIAIEPRVVAAIALALQTEAEQEDRARELARPASQWTALARARGVRSS